jgi:mRNA interferase MazF
VWWADLDPTQGHEQAGLRPVVVVSSGLHLALTRSAMVTVVPLTSRERPGLLHRVPIRSGKREGWAITEQLRTISAGRLTRPGWRLPPEEVSALREVLARMVDW